MNSKFKQSLHYNFSAYLIKFKAIYDISSDLSSKSFKIPSAISFYSSANLSFISLTELELKHLLINAKSILVLLSFGRMIASNSSRTSNVFSLKFNNGLDSNCYGLTTSY